MRRSLAQAEAFRTYLAFAENIQPQIDSKMRMSLVMRQIAKAIWTSKMMSWTKKPRALGSRAGELGK
jgi:hypothetical protein